MLAISIFYETARFMSQRSVRIRFVDVDSFLPLRAHTIHWLRVLLLRTFARIIHVCFGCHPPKTVSPSMVGSRPDPASSLKGGKQTSWYLIEDRGSSRSRCEDARAKL